MFDNGDRVQVRAEGPLACVGVVKEVRNSNRFKIKFANGDVRWYYQGELKKVKE